MSRICTHCNEEKEIEKFVRQGHLYRYKCKECLNKSLRTGKINPKRFKKGERPSPNTEFKKGQISGKQFQKGIIPWNKGKKNVYSKETLEKISNSGKGRKHTEEAKNKIALAARTGKSRLSYAYKQWRKKVFERDGFKCMECGCQEKLHPHHIIPWKDSEEKRFEVENGMTLCNSCHAKIEGFQKGHSKSKKQ